MTTDTKKLVNSSNSLLNTTKKKELEAKMRQLIREHGTDYDPIHAFSRIIEETEKNKGTENPRRLSLIKGAMSLFEFDNGVLMISGVSEEYRAFCIEFSRNLQKEYKCETPSEEATAELTALNFVRTLEIQYKLNGYLAMGDTNDVGTRYLAILSKELDRANRHYLNALQTLRMLKQPTLEVNIKTQTAIVGQNQIVQSNNNDKAK